MSLVTTPIIEGTSATTKNALTGSISGAATTTTTQTSTVNRVALHSRELNSDQQLISDLKEGIVNLDINRIELNRYPERNPHLKFYINLSKAGASQRNTSFTLPIQGNLDTGDYEVSGILKASDSETMEVTELGQKYKTLFENKFEAKLSEQIQRWEGMEEDLKVEEKLKQNIIRTLTDSLKKLIA